MPGFGFHLSDAEVEALVRYVRGLARRAAAASDHAAAEAKE
jgi:mono/diheme cytochrome c family protein